MAIGYALLKHTPPGIIDRLVRARSHRMAQRAAAAPTLP
jgi:hypothetical protein